MVNVGWSSKVLTIVSTERKDEAMTTDPEMRCSVCNSDKEIAGVASSPVGPISHVYCKTCLVNGAVPECDLIYLYEDVGDKGEGLAPWVSQLKTYKDGKYMPWDEWKQLRQAQ